jgi:hypothetical protein
MMIADGAKTEIVSLLTRSLMNTSEQREKTGTCVTMSLQQSTTKACNAHSITRCTTARTTRSLAGTKARLPVHVQHDLRLEVLRQLRDRVVPLELVAVPQPQVLVVLLDLHHEPVRQLQVSTSRTSRHPPWRARPAR